MTIHPNLIALYPDTAIRFRKRLLAIYEVDPERARVCKRKTGIFQGPLELRDPRAEDCGPTQSVALRFAGSHRSFGVDDPE
jgi:hypothetical protein